MERWSSNARGRDSLQQSCYHAILFVVRTVAWSAFWMRFGAAEIDSNGPTSTDGGDVSMNRAEANVCGWLPLSSHHKTE
jgi:hypothetical protein